MPRTTAAVRLALAALAAGSATWSAPSLAAQEPSYSADSRTQEYEFYTAEELDNLLAPVALYPDPILAQLLVAATYPEQIELAQRYVEVYGRDGLDDQSWDVSVRAIAHYEPVLNMLYERPNWATAIGRAYAMQPRDVMGSVQGLRRMARAQGNLATTGEQRVEVERDYIRIIPAQPRVIYVPVYDPYEVYYRPISPYVSVATPYWSFGIGYPIGAWLNYDLDWETRVVYYHGWDGYGRRHTWYHVSRPFIAYSSVYIGPRFRVVVIDRGISRRYVNYAGFGYYSTVHRGTRWDRERLPGRGYASRSAKPVREDRFGIPARRDQATGRPGKRDDIVPRVGSTAPRGDDDGGARPPRGETGARPPRGGDDDRGTPRTGDGTDRNRGNGNDRNGNNGRDDGRSAGRAAAPSSDVARAPIAEDRVKPVRVGGNNRPLYPRGEDIAPERVKGATVARREGTVDNGSWNPRTSERTAPRDVPRASSERALPRTDARTESRSLPRSEPRYEPRTMPRIDPRYEPRAMPRTEPRSEPRSTPRSVEPRSAPRASAPRSEPRSAPRVSAPRTERSAPRASAPRSERSAPTAPRAPRSEGRSRG